MGAKVARFIGLAESEGARALRLCALIFVVSAALALLKAAQGGIFLSAYTRKMIPWAFAASAMTIVPFSALAVAAAARMGPVRLALYTLLGGALASLALRGLLLTAMPGTPFLVYVIIETISGLTLIQTWSVVSGTVDARSAKRILPIAGVGASIAWTLGGFLVSSIVKRIGAEGLLLVVPVLLGFVMWLLRTVAKEDLAESVAAPEPLARASRAAPATLLESFRAGLEFVAQTPLMRLCLLLGVLSVLGEQLMEYQLLASVREHYGTPAAIASFFGRFFGVTSAITLIIQLGFSSRLLSSLGATQGLAVTPIATAFFALAGLIVPGFAPVILLRANDRVLKSALWSAAMEQTQTPLPVVRRAQARSLSRGVVAPLLYALNALGLAALPEQADLRLFSLLTMVVALFMAALVMSKLRRAYVAALRRAIDDRRLRLDCELAATTLDREAAETIARDLLAEDEGKAMLAIELLETSAPAFAAKLLPLSLEHPDSAVRIAALEGLTRVRTPDTKKVAALLTADPIPEVRRAAVRCLTAARVTDHALRRAFELGLSDSDPHVRAACHVACVLFEATAGPQRDASLLSFLSGGDPILMQAALLALDQKSGKNTEVIKALRHILRAGEPQLGLCALSAAVRMGARTLLADTGPLLEDPRTTMGAVSELLLWGEDALAEAASSIAPSAAVPPIQLEAKSVGKIAGLGRLLGHADASVRDRATRAIERLVHSGRCQPLGKNSVQPVLEREIGASFRYLSLLAGVAHDDGTPDWEIDPEYAFLGGEIELRFRAARSRVLCLLSLMQSRKLTSIVEVGLRRARAGTKTQLDAQIAELLEVELPIELSRSIAPLFDRLTLRERLLSAERVGLLERAAIEDPLAFIVELGDAHLRVCAMITYGERAAARYPELHKKDAALIPVFERMRFLRSVPLFAEIPGEDLRLVAEILDTAQHQPNEVVFHKGEAGEDMYIIVRGSVAIRDGESTIATLGAREFFGELSVIDREARSADAVIIEPAELLRLGAADLGELMARRPQIQEQILLVLVRRLRALNARLGQ